MVKPSFKYENTYKIILKNLINNKFEKAWRVIFWVRLYFGFNSTINYL